MEAKFWAGAPFNVAWNLQGLGQSPIFVSAVGQDTAANEIRQKMNRHGLDTSALQSSPHPTGTVDVRFDKGEPKYDILPDQAYDFLRADSLHFVPEEIAVIYHGSLIWRSRQSRTAVQAIRARIDAPVFVDLNIRRPWFQADQVAEMVGGIDSLKLNVDELAILAVRSPTDEASLERAASELLSRFSIRTLWVTAGSAGAYYFDSTGRTEYKPAPVIDRLVDTVGAGDAFAATVIDGMMSNQPPERILAKAVQFAARVCGLNGATTVARAFYENHPLPDNVRKQP